jgi:hypothetical protein
LSLSIRVVAWTMKTVVVKLVKIKLQFLRSGKFSDLNSACSKVLAPVKIFQFQDMGNEIERYRDAAEEEWSLYHNASLLINIRNWILRVFERCLSKNCGCLLRFFTLKILMFGRYVFIIVLLVTLIARFLFYVVVVSCFSYVNHALNYPEEVGQQAAKHHGYWAPNSTRGFIDCWLSRSERLSD